MQGPNKLLEDWRGRPLLRHVVDAALTSRAAHTVVVLGHEADRVRAALAGLPVQFVDNPEYEEGMAASIRAAVGAVDASASAMLFCLADMPRVSTAVLDALIDAHQADPTALAIQPEHAGRRGNPVLWQSASFADLLQLSGVEGARPLLQRHAPRVRAVTVSDESIFLDVDTPEDLARLRHVPRA